MPQPVQPSSWSFRPKSTLARPEISAAILAVIAEWTWVERGLVSLVGNAFGVSTDPGTRPFTLNTNRIAYRMMETAETMRARLALMDATVGTLLSGTTLEKRWAAFRKDLVGRSKERNRLAHAVWMLSDDFPNDLIESSSKSSTMFRWTLEDVHACLDRIVATRAEAHALLIATVAALHAGEIAEQAVGPKKG